MADENKTLKAIANLWARGHTYAEIGAHLGLTRGQVAGALGRLRESVIMSDPKVVKFPKDYGLRFKTVKPAPKAHRLFRLVISQMNAHQISRQELCLRVGVSMATFDNYRTRRAPKLEILEAMLAVFDMELVAVNKP